MQVLIVGGGASGMVAAIAARRMGAEVTILERNPRIGKKILATGNGRCNYTNINTCTACYHGTDTGFAESALIRFDVAQTIRFFEKLGVAHKVEAGGKVFPMSDQASSVLDVLRYELEAAGIRVICNARVVDIKKENGQFELIPADGAAVRGDRLILAAGGKAMPATGSDGSGLQLARKLGHTIIDIFPALVPLKLEGGFFKRIAGVKITGTAELLCGQQTAVRDRGDLLFTNYGISGPPILQISRHVGELLHNKRDARLRVTLIDTIPKEDLRDLLAKRFRNAAGKTVQFSLVGLINKRLIPVLLKEAGIAGDSPVKNLSSGDRDRILNILTNWTFRITGTTSWPNAQVTAGGVATAEIDPDTLESRLVKGLYFAGEIVDIDGACGGFNLQWAWSSGYVAGQSAVLSEGRGGSHFERIF